MCQALERNTSFWRELYLDIEGLEESPYMPEERLRAKAKVLFIKTLEHAADLKKKT